MQKKYIFTSVFPKLSLHLLQAPQLFRYHVVLQLHHSTSATGQETFIFMFYVQGIETWKYIS